MSHPSGDHGLNDNEPIAALATASGMAALGVIRLSGQGAWKILQSLAPSAFRPAPTPRQMRLAEFLDPQSGQVLDDLLICLFAAGKSFTGEEGAELFPHGSPYVIKRILAALIQAGFRMAEPGEFSRRAFLNGKLNLSEAEGVRGMTEALSQSQWQAARQLVTGRLSDHVQGLRKELIKAMAFLEARIDFPDEGDTQDIEVQQVRTMVDGVSQRIEGLAQSYESGKIAMEGLRVAIVGPPNAGKSTLLNALLRQDRAIVTEVAGTTRDYLEESLLLQGRYIRLVDTAGMRETLDEVEKEGIRRSLEIAQEADLVLHLVPIEDEVVALGNRATDVIVVRTKGDLAQDSQEQLPARHVLISALHGDGLDQLEAEIIKIVDRKLATVERQEEAYITSARQKAAVDEAQLALERFFHSHNEGGYDECLAFELQAAARSLMAIIGEVNSEDVLDSVFNEFCVGK